MKKVILLLALIIISSCGNESIPSVKEKSETNRVLISEITSIDIIEEKVMDKTGQEIVHEVGTAIPGNTDETKASSESNEKQQDLNQQQEQEENLEQQKKETELTEKEQNLLNKKIKLLDTTFDNFKNLDLREEDFNDAISAIKRLIEFKNIESIVDSGVYTDCYKITNQDLQDFCLLSSIQSQVFETKDLTICTKLEDTQKISMCQNSYNFYLAVTEKDASFCENIVEKDLRDGLIKECNEQVVRELNIKSDKLP